MTSERQSSRVPTPKLACSGRDDSGMLDMNMGFQLYRLQPSERYLGFRHRSEANRRFSFLLHRIIAPMTGTRTGLRRLWLDDFQQPATRERPSWRLFKRRQSPSTIRRQETGAARPSDDGEVVCHRLSLAKETG